MIDKLNDAIRRGDGETPVTYAAELARLAGLPLQAAGTRLPPAAVDAALAKHPSLSVGDRLAFKMALVRGGVMAR
jgi:hypothetical protein